MRVGQALSSDADAMCGECGTWWSTIAPRQSWLRSWDGEPLCADCADVMELRGELRAFADLALDHPTCPAMGTVIR